MLRIYLLLFTLTTAFCFSQKNESSSIALNSFLEQIHQLNFNLAKTTLTNIKDKKLHEKLFIFYNLKEYNNEYQVYLAELKTNRATSNSLYAAIDLLILSENEILNNNNRITAFNYAYEGFQLSKKINETSLQIAFLIHILKTYKLGVVNNDNNVFLYLKTLKKLSKNNPVYLFYYYQYKMYLNEIGILKGKGNNKNGIIKRKITNNCIQKIDSITQLFTSKNFLLSEYYHVKGLYDIIQKKYKSSSRFFKKEIEILNKKEHPFFNDKKYNAYKELARSYKREKKYSKALKMLNEAKKYENKNIPLKNDFVYNLYASDIYFGLHKKDSAFFSMKKAFHSSLQLNFEKQNNLISSLEIINRTKQKETENLQLKQANIISETKRKQNAYLFYTSLIIILLGFYTTWLILKNSKKKRLLAEQQQQLEAQKNITLLRKQELNALDAMLEGQEKERKRIAEDLHDNIGSVLATLKLHFENLKLNREKKQFNQEELYEKTEKLIDETYLKIRSIAHAKNSGVIANKGLLVALKLMAEKVSSANKTSIEVVDFGLDSRLENSIEIAVFRIIQELITNIIKHANAKNATINISNFKEALNIIIEDDGKGFDYNKVELKNGMGLNSIKTRIKHLNGTFNVDSSLGNGTSIIINIPL